MASNLGTSGHELAEAVQGAFATGLADAMVAGAVIALAAALFTIVRGPRASATEPSESSTPVTIVAATAVVAELQPELVG